MYQKHNDLNRDNQLTYLFSRFQAGLKAIPGNFVGTTVSTLYVVAVLALLYRVASPANSILERLAQPIIGAILFLAAIAVFIICVTVSAIPKGTLHFANAFRRVHMTNPAGEAPLLTKRYERDGKMVIEVFTQGIPVSQFQDNKELLESALNKRITKIEPGECKQSVRLHLAPGDAELPERIDLPQKQRNPSEILLGESLDGPVIADLDKIPHFLVGGSTGSGKTTLVKSIIYQLLCKRDSNGNPIVDVYVSDLKGGLDYPPHWRNRDCSFATSAGDTLAVLGQIVQELERRMNMFEQVSECEGVPCSSLDDFNRLRPGNQIRRIVMILDEIAELTDTTGMDKPHKEESATIVKKLSTIARLGRAFGVNLIVSTQRPDAVVVPGQIKNNLDGRICGKADNVLSQIILDNTDAVDCIPKDSQGLFLNQDGILFRGYLFDDKQKDVSHSTQVDTSLKDDSDWHDSDDE